MADEITARGKYLLISVPEFERDSALGPRKDQPMTSFLRLGAFHERWETQPGADLAKRVFQVSADWQGGHLTPQYGGEVAPGTLAGFPFLDDQRNRDGALGTVPPEERRDNSEKLFTRGGWWDHSDGNRVTTTYGDKVEVIRGNYKLVVMGRQEEPGAAASIDASGGVLQDIGNSMIGASVRAEYRQDVYSGVWHLENATLGFVQSDDFAGDRFSHHWGDKLYSTIGSEAGSVTKAGKPFGNPEIIDRKWAKKIESYTGSSANRIPSIHEETYAESTNTKTDVLHANELKIVGASMETTLAGALGSLTIAGAKTDVNLIGVTGEFTFGAKFGCTIGYTREVKIGSFDETSIPDKKKVALSELNTSLQVMHATLNSSTTTLQEKVTALQVGISALQVQLGI